MAALTTALALTALGASAYGAVKSATQKPPTPAPVPPAPDPLKTQASAAFASQAARFAMQRRLAAMPGRNATLLTGPLGVTAPSPAAPPTLLGQ